MRQRPSQMISHNTYHLIDDEEFFLYLTWKLIICFIDSCTLEMKSQSIAFSPSGSEHIQYIGFWPWSRDADDMDFVGLGGLQKYKDNFFDWVRVYIYSLFFSFFSSSSLGVAWGLRGWGARLLSHKWTCSLKSSLGCSCVRHFHWWVWGLLLVINAIDTLCVGKLWFGFSNYQLHTRWSEYQNMYWHGVPFCKLTYFSKLSFKSTLRVYIHNTCRGVSHQGRAVQHSKL